MSTRFSKIFLVKACVVCVTVTGLLVFLTDHRFVYRQLRATMRMQEIEAFPSGNDDHTQLRMVTDVQGLKNPRLSAISDITLPDSTRVIGVDVEGSQVAYVMDAMADTGPHVVNSVIAGQPVSVTYCNLVDCARVLTDEGQRPIDLRMGGQDGNMQMVIGFKGARYSQLSKKLPLQDMPFEVCTLGEWRAKHPQSRVFDNGLSAKKHG